MKTDIQRIVDIVLRRASRRGFVLPQEICAELAAAGLPEGWLDEVVTLAAGMLSNHGDCFFYVPTVSSRREQKRQRRLKRAVRLVIRGCQGQGERRGHGRVDFIHPVQVETEDGRSFSLLSRDLSVNGICLVGPSSLLGQKLRVSLPTGEGAEHKCFSVQIVWACVVGEGLCENGGTFLEIADGIDLKILGPRRGTAAVEPESHDNNWSL